MEITRPNRRAGGRTFDIAAFAVVASPPGMSRAFRRIARVTRAIEVVRV